MVVQKGDIHSAGTCEGNFEGKMLRLPKLIQNMVIEVVSKLYISHANVEEYILVMSISSPGGKLHAPTLSAL